MLSFMRTPCWLPALLAVAGCLNAEPSARDGPGYTVSSRINEQGTREDRVVYHGSPGEQPPADAASGGLLALSKRIHKQTQRAPGHPEVEAQGDITGPTPPPQPPPGGSRLADRRRRLMEIIQHPQPHHRATAAAILLDPIDPLSPLAAVAAGRIGDLQSEEALEQALADKRPSVREASLLVLIELHAPRARPACRRLLVKDPHPAVRSAAAKGLGVFRDRASLGQLRQAFEHDTPAIRTALAWALARLGDKRGLAYLRRLALAGDPHLSPGAMRALATLRQREAIHVLYQGLLAPHRATRETAFEGLQATPRSERDRTLSDLPPEQREALQTREEMLLCLLGQGPLPRACFQLLAHGNEQEKRLSIACMGHAGSVRVIPSVISALEDPVPAVRQAAARNLASLVKRHALRFPPDSDAPAEAWRVWWLRLHRLKACGPKQAVLVFPDGTAHAVRGGTQLHWNAPVVHIHPGQGPQGLKGGYVEVLCRGRRIRLDTPADPAPGSIHE